MAEFDALLAAVEPVYIQHHQAQLTNPTQQRAIGGGHPFASPLVERLLYTLIYYRLYVTGHFCHI